MLISKVFFLCYYKQNYGPIFFFRIIYISLIYRNFLPLFKQGFTSGQSCIHCKYMAQAHPELEQFSCFTLSSIEITGMHHHTLYHHTQQKHNFCILFLYLMYKFLQNKVVKVPAHIIQIKITISINHSNKNFTQLNKS